MPQDSGVQCSVEKLQNGITKGRPQRRAPVAVCVAAAAAAVAAATTRAVQAAEFAH